MEKNYGTMEKYGTMVKTMLLYRKLWNFDLRRKKLFWITKNYETDGKDYGNIRMILIIIVNVTPGIRKVHDLLWLNPCRER